MKMMNRSNPLRALTAAVLVAVAGGCDDGLTDLNRNPNAPEDATAEQLFANGVEASVSRVFGAGLHMDLTALWAQHYAEHLYTAEDRYELGDGTVSAHWSGFYTGPQMDFALVIEKGEAEGRPNVAAVASIMQQWTYHIMTDLWGDIGYSEALQGRDPDAGNQPKLDPQSQVYDGILSTLAAAAESLDPAAEMMDDADLIYGGDVERWRRFANSLRLRVAMRLSEVDEAKASAEFADALGDGVFESNDDNAVLTYEEDLPNVHPIYEYQIDRDDHTISATIVDTLKSLNDPRLPIYATPNESGEYVGEPNGTNADPELGAISRIGTYFTKPDASAVLMSYAEVLFLQAEAAERGWIAGDPAALYTAAITAAMQDLGIEQADIDAYLARPAVVYAGGDAGLAQIALQKWIALFGNGPEAWAEWRRTGVPALVAGPDALNGGRIPVRLPYPQSERFRNGDNLQEAIDRQGGASLNDPLWWDR
ncbi:MAG TPA: SusD/RagB family nutrient-binding outer membrane lipoprotein [Longimicrobiales bacterium]